MGQGHSRWCVDWWQGPSSGSARSFHRRLICVCAQAPCVVTRPCVGDWDSAWEIFEKQLPVDTPDMPDVMEILAFDNSAAESKAQRRQMEQDLKVGFGLERKRMLEIYREGGV